jgi:hypothetical protein
MVVGRGTWIPSRPVASSSMCVAGRWLVAALARLSPFVLLAFSFSRRIKLSSGRSMSVKTSLTKKIVCQNNQAAATSILTVYTFSFLVCV